LDLKKYKTELIILITLISAGICISVVGEPLNTDYPKVSPIVQKQENKIVKTEIAEIKLIDALQIQTGWTWTVDNYGYSKINGSVKNIGTKAITYFEITVEYLDANGKVLDTAYTNSNERINPGNEKRFEILHKHSPDFKGSRLLVNKVITD